MQENVMMMILYAGNATQLAFQALRKVKTHDFEEARELIMKSKEESLKSHQIQNEFLTNIASGHEIPINVFLIHAQDHLMNSVLAIDMIEEMIEVFDSYQ